MTDLYFPPNVICLFPLLFVFSVFVFVWLFRKIRYTPYVRWIQVWCVFSSIIFVVVNVVHPERTLVVVRLISPIVAGVYCIYLVLRFYKVNRYQKGIKKPKTIPMSCNFRYGIALLILMYTLSPVIGYEAIKHACIMSKSFSIDKRTFTGI